MQIARPIPASGHSKTPLLKKLFWVYFLLLIFEGALRKWILPELSAPLLLVRDPVALLILVEAYRTGKWPQKWATISGFLAVTMFILCGLQVIIVENPWMAALFGLRSYLLPFPVAFVMGENLTAEDLRKFGLCTLWILLPLTALEVAQYMAHPDSLLNVGAYKGGAQISYVPEHVRAAATFSFVTGPICYAALAAAFTFYGLINDKFAPRWLTWASTGALLLSIPVVGSRTVAYELASVAVCAGVAAMLGVTQLFRVLKIVAPILALYLLVSFLPIFSTASVSMHARFQHANTAEGGSVGRVIAHRTLVPIEEELEMTDFAGHPIGVGMGQGASAIVELMTGKAGFSLGEDELGRVMAEMGPLVGISFMLFRLVLALFFIMQALVVARNQEPLALFFVPLAVSGIFLGVLEQPTEQGFMVIGVAFTLAALKLSNKRTLETTSRNLRREPLRYSMPRPEQTSPGAGNS